MFSDESLPADVLYLGTLIKSLHMDVKKILSKLSIDEKLPFSFPITKIEDLIEISEKAENDPSFGECVVNLKKFQLYLIIN